MVNFSLGIILLLTQLVSLGGGDLPQIIEPKYSTEALAADRGGEVVVSFDVKDGFVINRIPPIQLKLENAEGVRLAQSDFVSPSEDPKSTDVYYVDVPSFKVGVSASKPGRYEIPGRLTYFFCSKADGFCSRQIIDVSVPVRVR